MFLILLSFLLGKDSAGQEINKLDIVKFKIKSITSIESDGKVKYTEFYNDKGSLIKRGSLKEDKQLHTDRELFYTDSSQLIEEGKFNKQNAT